MTSHVDSDRSPRRRPTGAPARLRTLVPVVALALLGLLVGSCDTTAKVTFPTRSFSTVESSGFIAPANACGQLGVDGNTNVKMRFVMVAGDNTPIRPDQALENGTVDLDTDAVSPSNSRLFDHPDLQCGSSGNGTGSLRSPPRNYPQNGDTGMADTGTSDDGGMTDTGGNGDGNGDGNGNGNGGNGTSGDRILQYDGTCRDGYSCGISVQGASEETELRRCSTETNVNVEPEGVQHVSDTDSPQLFGVLVENTGEMDGFRSLGSDLRNYDSDGDGTAETLVERRETQIATDRNGNRKTGLQRLVQQWGNAQDVAIRENRESRFGAWPIDGTGSPTSLIPGENTSWTTDPDEAEEAINQEFDDEVDGEDEANIVEALIRVLEDEFGKSTYNAYDKTLTLVVDGPPDEPVAAQENFSLQQAIETAQGLGVRIFVVHFDTARDTSALYDDPSYWEVQQGSVGNCSGDADCKNFETCREVHGYDTTGDQMVDKEPDGTFCMPQYREDGRLGPISDYAQLACATKGGYIYVKNARNDLEGAMSWLPYTMDGLWEAEVSVSALQSTRQKFAPGEAIRMQSSVEITAGGTTNSVEFSQIGGNHDSTLPQSGDTRSVLVTGEPSGN